MLFATMSDKVYHNEIGPRDKTSSLGPEWANLLWWCDWRVLGVNLHDVHGHAAGRMTIVANVTTLVETVVRMDY